MIFDSVIEIFIGNIVVPIVSNIFEELQDNNVSSKRLKRVDFIVLIIQLKKSYI